MSKLENVDFLIGDIKEKLKQIPESSVHCVVTSPPYWGLRDYDAEGQIGMEETPRSFANTLVDCFEGLKRVLHEEGSFWLNIGDSYYNYRPGKGQKLSKQTISNTDQDLPKKCPRRANEIEGLKEKDLVGIPWEVAFALRDNGWWLRQDIIWAKGVSFCETYNGACRPESVKDRFTSSHEYLFHFTNSQDYFFDIKAVKERGKSGKRNLRDVWTINPSSYSKAHFATFPVELVEPCIKASTPEGGVCAECKTPYKREGNEWHKKCQCETVKKEKAKVLDPFMGSGTSAIAAVKNNCKFIGIDLKEEYVEMAKERILNSSDVPLTHDWW